MSVTREGVRVPGEEQEGFSVAELLEKHFDTAFAAPDGIKKLRELILTLAMQGKLVPQDPQDQSASELLKEIETEKKRLVKEDGLRTEANEQIDENEKYLELPYGWEYCRLGNLARFIDYRGRTPKKVDSGIPLITAKNVRFGYINREPYEYVTENEYESWMTRGFPKIGDLLFTTEAPLGNITVIDIQERFALAQRVICFQLHEPDMATFIKWLVMSVPFQKQLLNNATGMTATGIKSSKLKEIPIPLPPLAEQRRIVAKIEQLMARCDELENLRSEMEKKRLTVHTAALAVCWSRHSHLFPRHSREGGNPVTLFLKRLDPRQKHSGMTSVFLNPLMPGSSLQSTSANFTR